MRFAPLLKHMIIFLDTETTGLYPGNICQLSYIMQDKAGIIAKNMYFAVDNVEYGAYKVHGLSPEILEELSGGAVFSDRISEIEKDFSLADLIITHNTAFDFMFLRKEFESCGRDLYIKREFCSMKKTTPICKLTRSSGKGYKYPKLLELCDYFNITEKDVKEETLKLFGEGNNFHDARYDTVAVYLAINKGLENEQELQSIKEFL